MDRLIFHTIEPVYDVHSKILILGTMPSPKSRENSFYYTHPQNRFWRVLSDVLGEELPQNNEERKSLLKTHDIALWDVLKSCEIKGADDSSIKNPEVNDINLILDSSHIRAVFTTGSKATSLYKRLCEPKTAVPSIYLPSTSPANCRHYSYERLLEGYKVILKYL